MAGRTSASGPGGALVLEDLLEDVAQNGLRVVGVGHVLTHAQDVTALTDVVLYIVIGAFVCQLCQANLLRCELFIQVVEVQTGWWKLFESRREYCGLQGRHRGLELGRYQSERLMLDSHL